MKRFFLNISTLLLVTTLLQAQVTIGSGQAPNKGALLDLKEKPDGTSFKGFGMPRVALQAIVAT